MSDARDLISVHEIERRLRAQAEAIVRLCLPNAVKDGAYYKAGSIAGERGQSLVVTMAGAGRGMWTDYAADEHGDLIDMIRLTRFGGDKGEAVKFAKSWLGLDDLDPARLATMRAEARAADVAAEAAAGREAEAKKRGARALWMDAAPLTGECPASRYLAGRGIVLDAYPGSLRYHPEVWNRDAGVKLPCMVASMVDPHGAHVATHRTWLGRAPRTAANAGQWVKADAADLGVPMGSAKKVIGKAGGAFVPLRRGATDVSIARLKTPDAIYLTEGIEDALTVAVALPHARVAAAYSLRNIGMIAFPAMIERIVICADRDGTVGEVDALERAIARQQAAGKHVQVVMPPAGVKDFNAWMLRGGEVPREDAA